MSTENRDTVATSQNRDTVATSQNRDTVATSQNRDTVYIGKKPLMAYVTSTLIQLATFPQVTIKARGMSIGRAVDVAQIILRKTDSGHSIGSIKIDSELLESQDGRTRNVSTIEIAVKRNT